MATFTRVPLAGMLPEAAEAHHEYEERLGERDDDWPAWYAGYTIAKLDE